jgi:integrase
MSRRRVSGRYATEQPGLVIELADWPPGDRAAWLRVVAGARTPFRRYGGGGSRSRFTLRAYCCGYGRWLAYLRDAGALDPAVPASARVTEERLDGYLHDLQQHGNADQTLVSRLSELKGALSLLEPGSKFGWVTRPHGIHISRHLAMTKRDRPVHHGATLLAWAQRLFAAGLAHSQPRCRRTLIRTAVMIGVLVLPAPRLGALAKLRLGRNLQRHEDGWVLDQDASITKMGRAEWCPLHEAVTPMIDRYLAVERIELLAGKITDRLWIAQGGEPLAEGSIARQIRELSDKEFHRPFGPHAFRHSLGTTNATDNYAAPLDASTLLGHSSPQTTSRYYNLAKTTAAAERHAARLRRLRGESDK